MLRIIVTSCVLLGLVEPIDARAPDIILMMADDMGFSDLGCYGSEIPTPNLDALASHGIRFSQFYNTSRCCPSRASLLTGLYPHQAGMGDMNHVGRGPGYRGQLLAETPTIAEMFRTVGYSTTMVGKWHLTISKTIDEGPNGSWPLERGFEKYYGSMEGAKNYFRTKWLFDQRVEVKEFADDFFYTDAVSERAARYILEQPTEKPIFSYVAFYAPHFPLQAPAETIAKFRGKYMAGWDVMRQARLAKQKELGVVPTSTTLSPRADGVPAWETLGEQKRDELDLRMAIYAAQVNRLDQGAGRIIDALRKSRRLDNALVIFLSDNGGTSSGGASGSGRVDLLGTPDAELQSTYGAGWGNVSNTPYRQFKANTHEGGIRAPLIMHWPQRLGTEMRLEHRPAHIIDLAATCIDAAGEMETRARRTFSTRHFEGTSLIRLIERSKTDQPRALYFEHQGSRAVRFGKWKLVNRAKNGPWELYDVEADPTELQDLSPRMPEQAEKLAGLWQEWAKRCNVIRPNNKREKNTAEHGTSIGPLAGVVVDDVNAIKVGRWQSGSRLDGYYGSGYLYSSDPAASIEFLIQLPDDSQYELRLLYAAHQNRGHSIPVTITQGIESTKRLINRHHHRNGPWREGTGACSNCRSAERGRTDS